MPIYYMVSGILESQYRAESSNPQKSDYPTIEHIPGSIMQLLMLNHIIVANQKIGRPLLASVEFNATSELPGKPLFFTHPHLRGFYYYFTDNFEDAKKLANIKTDLDGGYDGAIRLRPIFEITTLDSIPDNLLCKRKEQSEEINIAQNSSLPPQMEKAWYWDLKASYIPGYANINGEKYEIESLKKKMKPYEYGTGDIIAACLTFLVIPVLIYLAYRLYKYFEEKHANSLWNQADSYVTARGELFVKKEAGEFQPSNRQTESLVSVTRDFELLGIDPSLWKASQSPTVTTNKDKDTTKKFTS